jgi:hypothetical protein
MPSPADLEKDPILAFEQNLAVVQPPRRIHSPVSSDQVFPSWRDIHRRF